MRNSSHGFIKFLQNDKWVGSVQFLLIMNLRYCPGDGVSVSVLDDSVSILVLGHLL